MVGQLYVAAVPVDDPADVVERLGVDVEVVAVLAGAAVPAAAGDVLGLEPVGAEVVLGRVVPEARAEQGVAADPAVVAD